MHGLPPEYCSSIAHTISSALVVNKMATTSPQQNGTNAFPSIEQPACGTLPKRPNRKGDHHRRGLAGAHSPSDDTDCERVGHCQQDIDANGNALSMTMECYG